LFTFAIAALFPRLLAIAAKPGILLSFIFVSVNRKRKHCIRFSWAIPLLLSLDQ
jgi:hypothetical protein